MNIYYYANHNSKIGDEAVPPTLKVLKFQRDLLIGGLKNQDEKLGVDCRNVVKGLKSTLKNTTAVTGVRDYIQKQMKTMKQQYI